MIENFQIIAHRGASKYAPENTLSAFNHAIALGATCIECDIAFTKDAVPIIFHDDDLDRTTNAKGRISSRCFAELQTLDAGSWFDSSFCGEKIMTLRTLLEWHNQYDVMLNLEIKKIKTSLLNDYVNIIINEVNVYSKKPQIIYSSFQKEIIARLAEVADSRPRALLVSRWLSKYVRLARELGCHQLNVGNRSLSSHAVEYTHSYGLKLGVYTINDLQRAQFLKEIGVDAIFSDDLLLGHQLLEKQNLGIV